MILFAHIVYLPYIWSIEIETITNKLLIMKNSEKLILIVLALVVVSFFAATISTNNFAYIGFAGISLLISTVAVGALKKA